MKYPHAIHASRLPIGIFLLLATLGEAGADTWSNVTGSINPNSTSTKLGIGINSGWSFMAEIRASNYQVLKLSTSNGNSNVTLSGSPSGTGNLFGINSYGASSGIAFGTGDPALSTGGSTQGIGMERMRITSGGDVGIGTTAPGSLNSRHKILEVSAAGVSSAAHPSIVLRSGAGYSSIPAWEMLLSSGSASGTTDFQLMSGNQGRLIVQGSNGNVGIGTYAPTARLEVDAEGDESMTGSWANALKVSANRYPSIRLHAKNSNKTAFIGNDNDGGLYFAVNGTGDLATGYSHQLVLRPDGKVGIGVGSPQAKFHVGGAVKVDGALEVASIKTTTWTIGTPDYVFEKGYKLATLDNVEKFVREKKHLPEIPSAGELEKKGMDLAEMNLRLLKKVEELTLYAIEQGKTIKRQQGRLEEQAERLSALERRLPRD